VSTKKKKEKNPSVPSRKSVEKKKAQPPPRTGVGGQKKKKGVFIKEKGGKIGVLSSLLKEGEKAFYRLEKRKDEPEKKASQ